MANVLYAKRKRALVFYAEVDDDADLEQDLGIVEVDRDDDELPEGDTEYGSRKKTKKRKLRPRKRINADKPTRARPQKPFRFLDLPAELRDYIYELALVEPHRLTLVSKMKAQRRTVTRGKLDARASGAALLRRRRCLVVPQDEDRDGSSNKNTLPNSLSPNLLAVNKQIHSEGIGYLYKQPIILGDTMALHSFLAAIGPANRLVLSDITVSAWGHGRGSHKAMNFASLTLLAACVNLTKLQFDFELWGWRGGSLARQLYRDGHFFLEAYGAAHGRKDAAVEILHVSKWTKAYPWDAPNVESTPGSEQDKIDFQAELRALLTG